MLPLADAFAQIVIATLWIFSMGGVDVGALGLSVQLDSILQRHRYRIKDWRYSPAAQVCDFHFFEIAAAACCDFVAVEGGGKRGYC